VEVAGVFRCVHVKVLESVLCRVGSCRRLAVRQVSSISCQYIAANLGAGAESDFCG